LEAIVTEYFRGERVYDPRTGRYLGRYEGPYGSAFARVAPPPEQKKPTELKRNEDITHES
jgi:hypothetical protein